MGEAVRSNNLSLFNYLKSIDAVKRKDWGFCLAIAIDRGHTDLAVHFVNTLHEIPSKEHWDEAVSRNQTDIIDCFLVHFENINQPLHLKAIQNAINSSVSHQNLSMLQKLETFMLTHDTTNMFLNEDYRADCIELAASTEGAGGTIGSYLSGRTW